MAEEKDKKWKKFEKLVSKIQQDLAPNAKVIYNEKVLGKITKKERQIDISVRQNIGQYNVFIAIDCKDHKDPLDVTDVEEFMGLIQDVGANKGAIVSASGFSKTAKTRAFDAGIDLYRLVDTKAQDWKAYVTIPVLCDIREVKSCQFEFRSETPGPFKIQAADPLAIILYRENGSMIDSVINLLINKWNLGYLPVEPGFHENIKLIDIPTCVKTGENLYHVEVFANIIVEKNLYFGHLPITEMEGFEDQRTGGVISKGFRTGNLDVNEVEEKWQKLESEEDLVITPTMKIIMYDISPRREIKQISNS
jgi:hypothetical protein